MITVQFTDKIEVLLPHDFNDIVFNNMMVFCAGSIDLAMCDISSEYANSMTIFGRFVLSTNPAEAIEGDIVFNPSHVSAILPGNIHVNTQVA